MLVRVVELVVVLGLAGPAAAHGPSWPVASISVAHDPADALAELAIEPPTYDPATHCSKRPKPGMTALVDWLLDVDLPPSAARPRDYRDESNGICGLPASR